jgi:hypothetical protein
MNRHPILSDTQRQAITTAHFDLDEREIERYWTLSAHDLLRINRRRRDTNRFGFAVQLCLLRFPGWPPRPGDKVPLPLLAYVAQQLEIKTDNIEEYFRRQPTRSDHFREILDLYGFRSYNQRAEQELTDWIRAEAHHWNTPTGVFMALLDQMRHRRIVLSRPILQPCFPTRLKIYSGSAIARYC